MLYKPIKKARSINFRNGYTSYFPEQHRKLEVSSKIRILLAGAVYLYYFSQDTFGNEINLENIKTQINHYGGKMDMHTIMDQYLWNDSIRKEDLVLYCDYIYKNITSKDRDFIYNTINYYNDDIMDSEEFKLLYETNSFQLTLNYEE